LSTFHQHSAVVLCLQRHSDDEIFFRFVLGPLEFKCTYKEYVHSLRTESSVQSVPKSKPAYFCNNVVYCQPIFIIFGTYTLEEICNRGIYSLLFWPSL